MYDLQLAAYASSSRIDDAEESAVSADVLVPVLRGLSLFSQSSEARLRELAQGAVQLELPPRAVIFTEGAPADAYYVLLEGVVRVFHHCGEGRQVTVKHLVPPTTFGDIEVISGERFIESTETLSAAHLVRLDAARFVDYVDRDPQAARELLQLVCRRYCSAARNEHALFFDVQARMASLFLTYVDLFGKPVENGVRIHLHLTYDDLANGVGIVRRSVTRTLGQWREHGWVSRHKGWFVVHDRRALAELCAGLRFPGAPQPG